ncbi:MAG: exopolyphosphatase [Vibrio sp.]
MPTLVTAQQHRHIAAIDLGSNSFHMVVAKVVNQELQLISRHKVRVRLAQGLDEDKNIDQDAMERGLECLGMFAERIEGFDVEDVRIAATHTLRRAPNAQLFMEKAKQVIPFPIEVIAGQEEARLIYLGVAHTQPEWKRKLVVDIGGGSTELIVGHEFEPEHLNSKQMGCVSYTDRFFEQGKLSHKRFNQAILAAEQKLESLSRTYKNYGWDAALGSSGTIKAVQEVCVELGHDDGFITAKRLNQLIDLMCEAKSIDKLEIPALSPDRQPVFAAGVAILKGVFNSLDIDKMAFSSGALREGLLYEMEERFHRSDIRMRTTESLARKHSVDLSYANQVRMQAKSFLSQIGDELGIAKKGELSSLLGWSALLHEVGLSMNYSGYHKHSAYILQHTNMPGFNQEQQKVVATLARFQRKSLKLKDMPQFTLFKKKHILPLIAILRLSIVLNVQRSSTPLPEIFLTIKKDDDEPIWHLSSEDPNWLEDNRLLCADLHQEQEYWHAIGWQLSFE